MQLEEFYDYKNKLVEDLLTNEKIVRLIADTLPIFEKYESRKLVYTQVFPMEYIPDTIEDGKTFICIDVDIQKADGSTFLFPVLYVWVFSHRSRLILPEGGLRIDKLCSEIAKTINGSRKYGLGELNLHSVRRFVPMTDYYGKVLTFHAKDFNRLYDSNKPIPSNRKIT